MVTTRPDEYERARQLIDDAVLQHINTWATIVRLVPPTDARVDQFRDDVTEALRACMRVHIAGPSGDPDKEQSKKLRKELRKAFLARRRARIAAVKNLRDAYAARWPPLYHEFRVLASHPHPTAHQHELEALAEAMRLQADEWKSTDRGGHPLIMRAFNALAEGLVVAYQRATGKTGVGHGAREGKLRAFVERLLPVADEIAKAVTGKPLETPATPGAIGEYLHRAAKAD
jgi:hypothetical protein